MRRAWMLGLWFGCGPRVEAVAPPCSCAPPAVDVPALHVDRAIQLGDGEVDVLFVIDASPTLDERWSEISEHLHALFDRFTEGDVDFHVGVTSADPLSPQPGASGTLRTVGDVRYIDRSTPNPDEVFAEMVDLDAGAVGGEARAAAWTLLEQRRDDPENEGFYREDAVLHLVFVSDRDDESASEPVTRQEFLWWMRTLKGASERVVAHAAYGAPGTGCGEPGMEYRAYVLGTGGAEQVICDADWVPFVEAVRAEGQGLRREFFLSKLPVADPARVQVQMRAPLDGEIVTWGFSTCGSDEVGSDPSCEVVYEPGRNSVRFIEFVPWPNAEILIAYPLAESATAAE